MRNLIPVEGVRVKVAGREVDIDDKDHYKLTGLAPGRYLFGVRLSASTSSEDPASTGGTLVRSEPQTLSVANSVETVTLVIPRTK